jgi:hypothetical protein
MSEQLYEALNPKTYLELATELSSKTQSAAKRTAADRAYYAAFLSSRDILAEKGYITPYYNLDDHKYVAENLKDKNVLRTLGNDENRLRLARNLITYDTCDISSAKQHACSLDWMLKIARAIIEGVEALPPNPQTRR